MRWRVSASETGLRAGLVASGPGTNGGVRMATISMDNPRARVSWVAKVLKDEGVSVSYDAPRASRTSRQTRDGGVDAEFVHVVYHLLGGARAASSVPRLSRPPREPSGSSA